VSVVSATMSRGCREETVPVEFQLVQSTHAAAFDALLTHLLTYLQRYTIASQSTHGLLYMAGQIRD